MSKISRNDSESDSQENNQNVGQLRNNEPKSGSQMGLGERSNVAGIQAPNNIQTNSPNQIKNKGNNSNNQLSSSQFNRRQTKAQIKAIELQEIMKHLTFKEKIELIVQDGRFDLLIIYLVVLYTLLIFIYFALDNSDNRENADVVTTLNVVQIIEMCILAIFTIEIVMKVIGFGYKVYFKDKWQLFDALIIIASIILLATDMSLDSGAFQITQFKQIQNQLLRYQTKTPVEKILEIFNNLKENVDDQDYIKKIDWSIEMISSNKLYEVMYDKEDKEAQNWILGNNLQIVPKNDRSNTKKLSQIAESTEILVSSHDIQKIELPEKVKEFFYQGDTIESVNFNIFEYHQKIQENELSYLLIYLTQYKNDILSPLKVKPNKLFALGEEIKKGYKKVPYHNYVHSFDVTFTVHFFLSSCGFKEIGKLDALDQLILYVGAAAHDYGHMGLNNIYLVNSRDPLAIRYNDKSPLENMHVSSLFTLLKNPSFQITENFSAEQKKKFRERCIQMILATDNSMHFADLAKLKGRLASAEFDPSDKDKNLCMDSLLHAADISNPFKPFHIYDVWCKRVLEEFWLQGDKEKEKGLPVSYLCDRYTVNVAKSQLGFIDFFVKPYYETLFTFMPNSKDKLSIFETNKEKYKDLIEFYDKELEKLNLEKDQKEAAEAIKIKVVK